MAGLYVPLPTLRSHPRGGLRTDRGRRGLLLLHRSGLSPHTPCRSPGALTHVAACTLARSPIRDPLPEGFRHFVTSMPAPVASGGSESPGGPCTHWKAPPCHGARGIPDPFDPRVAAATDEMARNAAARFRGDPWLVGYFVDNELSWGRGWSTDPREYYALAINTLALGPESPAKSVLAAQLIETYREPERLAQAWGISLASWDELRSAGFVLPPASFDNPAVIRDLAAFTRRSAEAYFRTVAEALRRYDPDHLYLGSRFAWRTREAVEACAHWCDVVSFNLYQRSIAHDREEWARFHALGKPALIGEFHFGSTDRGLFLEGLGGVGRGSERGPPYAH